jgi:hypothetical protein
MANKVDNSDSSSGYAVKIAETEDRSRSVLRAVSTVVRKERLALPKPRIGLTLGLGFFKKGIALVFSLL